MIITNLLALLVAYAIYRLCTTTDEKKQHKGGFFDPD